MTATTNTTAGKAGSLTTVELDHPITRGETEIRSVQIRKPKAGDLRGVSLSDLFDMKADTVMAVLPRVSTPTLAPHEINQLEVSDLFKFSVRLVAVLLPEEAQQEVTQLGLN